MIFEPGKWSRRLWLTNNVLLLVLFIAALGMIGYLTTETLRDSGEGGVRAPTAGRHGTDTAVARPRAVRYGTPEEVTGTSTKIVLIHYGAGFTEPSTFDPSEIGVSYSRAPYGQGPIVNVVFLPPTGAARLLTDRAAYFADVTYPRARPSWRGDEIDSTPYISYEVSFEDTDSSGSLDRKDDRELYVSALDGTGFRRVLPQGYRLKEAGPLAGGRILILALDGRGMEPDDTERFPQRAFVFTPATGELRPDPALDSLSTLAGRIVGERVSERTR